MFKVISLVDKNGNKQFYDSGWVVKLSFDLKAIDESPWW